MNVCRQPGTSLAEPTSQVKPRGRYVVQDAFTTGPDILGWTEEEVEERMRGPWQIRHDGQARLVGRLCTS